jgi:hypothetical protein
MTPHHAWFCYYEPSTTPMRLANDKIMYSAGRRLVLLQLDNVSLPRVLLMCVLHILDLQNNL